MKIQDFVKTLNCRFFCGVPDSQLKSLCDYLMNEYGIDPKHHIIAANEGNCTAIARDTTSRRAKFPRYTCKTADRAISSIRSRRL